MLRSSCVGLVGSRHALTALTGTLSQRTKQSWSVVFMTAECFASPISRRETAQKMRLKAKQ